MKGIFLSAFGAGNLSSVRALLNPNPRRLRSVNTQAMERENLRVKNNSEVFCKPSLGIDHQ